MKDFLLIVMTVLLNTAGQFVMKMGMNNVGRISVGGSGLVTGFLRAFTSPFVLSGLLLYGLSAALWIVIVSRVNLSWAYPLVSMSYVIVAILSPTLLHEKFSLMRLIGTVIICGGVAVVARTPSH